MHKKTSGKKSIKSRSKKAVSIVRKSSKQNVPRRIRKIRRAVKIKLNKSNQQKRNLQTINSKEKNQHKTNQRKTNSQNAVSKKNISKKTLPKKKSKISSKQKKENPKQKNEKTEILAAGHGLEIQKLEEEFNNLKALLKEKRKAGVDTFVDEMKLFTIPPKIQLLKIEFYVKTYDDISSTFSEVRTSLESAKPEPTILDMPVVDESEKNPFEHLHKEESALPLSEDAKNYTKELGKKGIFFSEIRESFSHLFRKRGGK